MTNGVVGLLLVVASVLLLGACGGDGGAQGGAPSQPQVPASEGSADETEAATPTPASESPAPAQTEPGGNAQTIQVQVVGGQVQTANSEVNVPLGTPVRLEVASDTADELHVHGYEQHAPVSPGSPAVLEFTADIPGQFEVELENTQTELLQLRVQ